MHHTYKTFGYIHRTPYGVGFEVLAEMNYPAANTPGYQSEEADREAKKAARNAPGEINRLNPRITVRYPGITDADINGILLHEFLCAGSQCLLQT